MCVICSLPTLFLSENLYYLGMKCESRLVSYVRPVILSPFTCPGLPRAQKDTWSYIDTCHVLYMVYQSIDLITTIYKYILFGKVHVSCPRVMTRHVPTQSRLVSRVTCQFHLQYAFREFPQSQNFTFLGT